MSTSSVSSSVPVPNRAFSPADSPHPILDELIAQVALEFLNESFGTPSTEAVTPVIEYVFNQISPVREDGALMRTRSDGMVLSQQEGQPTQIRYGGGALLLSPIQRP